MPLLRFKLHYALIKKSRQSASYRLMIDMLDEVLSEWEGNCKILLENSAGKPGSIGTTLEELIQVRNLCEQPEKIGFCLDTCHAFASGLWNGENWENVLENGIELGYFDQLIKTSQLKDIPFILETPKEEVTHKEEIRQLQEKWEGG